MRILTIASEVPPTRSGVAVSVGRIVEGLTADGHSVTVMSYADAPLLQGDRVRLSGLGLRLAGRRRFLRDFDVVHLHGPAPTVSDVILARWKLAHPGVPLVYTHHFDVVLDAVGLRGVSRGYRRLTRWLAQASTVIVTTTESYRERICPDGRIECVVVPWGVDPVPVPARSGRGAGPLRVLSVGQLRRYKGHGVAIDAVRGAGSVELTIVGRGPLEAQLSDVAATLPNVEVRTDVDDAELARLYRSRDVVLLASTNVSEAFGITLLEGMAAGCVPVASDLPGVRDVAGTSGLLFPPGDAAALRDRLLDLAAAPEDLAERSARSIRVAADHPWERTVSDYVALLRRVAETVAA